MRDRCFERLYDAAGNGQSEKSGKRGREERKERNRNRHAARHSICLLFSLGKPGLLQIQVIPKSVMERADVRDAVGPIRFKGFRFLSGCAQFQHVEVGIEPGRAVTFEITGQLLAFRSIFAGFQGAHQGSALDGHALLGGSGAAGYNSVAVLAVLAQRDVSHDGIDRPQVAAHALSVYKFLGLNLLLLVRAADGAQSPQTDSAHAQHRPDSADH